MEAHDEPLAQEAASFFGCLPSKPRMVARTNCDTPYHPMIRVLAPITDAAIISRWSDALRQALLDCIQEREPRLQWTGFMPVRIEARPHAWDTQSPESNNFLLVCVTPETTRWRDALDAALDCKAVLNTHGIANMDVAVAEMDVVAPGGPGGEPSAADEAKVCPAPAKNNVELQDIFDIRFSKPTFSRVLARINLAVLPFLPLPGQSLQPIDTSDPDKELPASSLACYVRLQDEKGDLSETLYALTSRHVAVQGAHDQYSIKKNEPESSSSDKYSGKAITIACGSKAVIDKQQIRLRQMKRLSAMELNWVTKATFSKGQPSDAEIADLELVDECANKYLEAIQSGLAALGSRGDGSSRTRHVGTVAYSAEHSIDAEGFWKDWALVAVSPTDSPSPTQYRQFFKSKVIQGHWLDVVDSVDNMLRVDDVIDSDYSTLDSIDDAEVTIKAPHAPMALRGRDSGTTLRPVFKRGAASNLTAGLLSPIEAVLRRPLPSVDAIAWAWPVFSPVLHPESAVHHGTFSTGGDSGSLVFDTDGVAIGMVDAGFGCHANKARRHFVQPDQDPAAEPTALSSAARHDVADLEEPSEAQIDVSLVTPIDRIFASIKEVTGRTPRMV
ncbi:hypothetical protein F503_03237 [Ophiostoma piceae UAMH 11346]|uniref:Uncharacterized protein n=1 Tax=Ophiostoma piceae (strain UAMH 11346) TaxID=1262450 RepID=S3D0P7_OPHP1|nr:hypothetical protein F503_03237 [Ophiostoma piceae UAMH 11346]